MQNLQKFNYKNKNVRLIKKDGEPWWILKDVCSILDISHIKDTARRLDPDEVGQTEVIDRMGRKQKMWCVNESGLYNVILRSDKPEAKPFRKWVTSEVLPTIRKTGGYVSNDDAFISTYLPFADDQTKMLFKSTLQTVRQLNDKIEADKPKVLFADAVTASKTDILIGELAKIIRQNGCDIGEKRLFKWLREHGYLISRKGTDYNAPTQRSVDMGLFRVKETAITHSDGHTTISKTTKVTGKGQSYFINKFLAQ